MTLRFTHKGRFPLDRPAECRICGTMYGLTTLERFNTCDATACLNCGTRQCMVNGLGNGSCGVCLTGLLIGWSGNDKTCGRVNCNKRAVARTPRIGFGCREHSMMEPTVADRKHREFVRVDDNQPRYTFRQDWSRGFDWSTVDLFFADDASLDDAANKFAEAEVARRAERDAPRMKR